MLEGMSVNKIAAHVALLDDLDSSIKGDGQLPQHEHEFGHNDATSRLRLAGVNPANDSCINRVPISHLKNEEEITREPS